MKKEMKKAWMFVVIPALLTGCSPENNPSWHERGVPLTLTGDSREPLITRGSNVPLPPSTEVGVYVLPTSMPFAATPYRNILYSATGNNGILISSNPAVLNIADSYDVLAYAPRLETEPADATVVRFNHGTDLLYAPRTGVTISGATAAADLLFEHKMSQMMFTLVSGTGNPDLTNAVLQVSGFSEYANLDLTTGILTAVTGSGAFVTEISNSICFVPGELTLVVTVTTADNREYSGTITRAGGFVASESYTYTLTLNKNDASLGVTGHLIDWMPVSGGNISVEG